MSKQYFPHTSAALFDPRVSVRIEDESELFEDDTSTYDVIVICHPIALDSTFQREKLERVRSMLNPGGILSVQAGSLWLNMNIVRALRTALASTFTTVEYAFTTLPTHPSGQVGIMLACVEQGR